MPESINVRTNALSSPSDSQEVRALLTALRQDNVNLRTKFTALLAKLDADAGVTDTNYAATLVLPALNTNQ